MCAQYEESRGRRKQVGQTKLSLVCTAIAVHASNKGQKIHQFKLYEKIEVLGQEKGHAKTLRVL
jgi:hypothetical protein